MISRRNVYFPVKFSHYFLRSIPKYVMQVKTCLFHWSCIFHRQFLVFLANNSNLNERVRILSSVNNRQRIRYQNIDVWRRQTEVTDLRHSKHFIINQFERRSNKQTVLFDFDLLRKNSQENSTYSNFRSLLRVLCIRETHPGSDFCSVVSE